MSRPTSYSYLFDHYRLTEKELLYEGHVIHLSQIQLAVLHILVEDQGRFFTKDELVKAYFKNAVADPNNIEQAISDLRGRLHDDAKESRFIKTERGKGYCFIAGVRKVRDEDLDDAHVEPEPATAGSKDEISTFKKWLYGPGKVITQVLIVSLVLTVLITSVFSVSEKTGRWAKTFACLAQFIVVLGIFIHFRRQRASLQEVLRKAIQCNDLWDTKIAKDIAQYGFEQHIKCWQWLLLAWLLLYIFLTFIAYKDFDLSQMIINNESRGYALSITLTFLNNLNTLVILYCFYVLNKQAEDEEERLDTGDSLLTIIIIILLFVTVSEVLLLAPIQKDYIPDGASLVSGVAGGIAMALYVGRLQSKFLGPPLWLLIFLYSYTAIQPLFTQLEKNTWLTAILVNIALFLKCLLYLYIIWLFQSGRLLFYFRQVRLTYKEVMKQWQEFRKPLQ